MHAALVAVFCTLLLAPETFGQGAGGQILPGRFIIELSNECREECRCGLEQALQAIGRRGCSLRKRRTRQSETSFFEFIKCTEEDDEYPQLSEISAAISKPGTVTGTSVLKVTEDSKIELERLHPSAWSVDAIDGLDDGLGCTKGRKGRNVDIYVVDTGCHPRSRSSHVSPLCYSPFEGVGCRDQNGHGTSVASIASSRKFGVAPFSRLHCLRVMDRDGYGNMSGLIDSVSEAIEHYASYGSTRAERRLISRGAVINISLSGPFSSALNKLMKKAVGAFPHELYFAVAAGNQATDACQLSPASASTRRRNQIYSVMAHDGDGELAYFSNFGSCTDIAAPGLQVTTKSVKGGPPVVKSGTSMATPHVGGAIAVLLSNWQPSSKRRPVSLYLLSKGRKWHKRGTVAREGEPATARFVLAVHC